MYAQGESLEESRAGGVACGVCAQLDIRQLPMAVWERELSIFAGTKQAVGPFLGRWTCSTKGLQRQLHDCVNILNFIKLSLSGGWMLGYANYTSIKLCLKSNVKYIYM